MEEMAISYFTVSGNNASMDPAAGRLLWVSRWKTWSETFWWKNAAPAEQNSMVASTRGRGLCEPDCP